MTRLFVAKILLRINVKNEQTNVQTARGSRAAAVLLLLLLQLRLRQRNSVAACD